MANASHWFRTNFGYAKTFLPSDIRGVEDASGLHGVLDLVTTVGLEGPGWPADNCGRRFFGTFDGAALASLRPVLVRAWHRRHAGRQLR